MRFKIFENKNLIQGISDSSFGSINEKRTIEFLESLGHKKISAKNIIWAEQVFSSNVHICQPKDFGKVIKNVDGLISNIPGQILSIVSADCLPILLFDPKKRVAGVLHGSRECLIKGIVKKAIDKMISVFGARPENILVGIGPHIRVCHYWLKEKTFQDLKNTKFKKYFKKRNDKIFFDLTKLAMSELLKLGIKKKNIEDCKICTFCQFQKYFSARKEQELPGTYKEKNSRFSSFLGLKQCFSLFLLNTPLFPRLCG